MSQKLMNEMRNRMFDDGDDGYMKSDPKKRTMKDDFEQSIIKTRFPVRQIKVADIVSKSPGQTRMSDLDPEKYEEDRSLIESIKVNGIVVPIMVQEIPDDSDDILAPTRYRTVYGHRRYAAAKHIGISMIAASVVPKGVDVSLVTYVENVGVRSLKAYEQAVFIDQYITKHCLTQTQFAEKAGLNRSFVGQALRAYEVCKQYDVLTPLFKDGFASMTIITLGEMMERIKPSDYPEFIAFVSVMRSSDITQLRDIAKSGADILAYLRTRKDSATLEVSPAVPNELKNSGERSDNNKEECDFWQRAMLNSKMIGNYAKTWSLKRQSVMDVLTVCQETQAPSDYLAPLMLYAQQTGKIDREAVRMIDAIYAQPKLKNIVMRQTATFAKFMSQGAQAAQLAKEMLSEDQEEAVRFIQKISGQSMRR